MPASTTDYTAAALSALLVSSGLDLTNTTKLVIWLAALEPKHGLIPVETDSTYGDVLTAPVPDAEGANPTLLVLSGDNTLDISNFSHLQAVVLEDSGPFHNEGTPQHHYTISDTLETGPKSITIYLGDLSGVASLPFVVTFGAVGTLIGGNTNGDIIEASQNDYIILGTGQGDQINGGTGSHEVLTGGGINSLIITGTGNYVEAVAGSSQETLIGGSGANDILKSAFANTVFNDGAGANQELIGTGGSSTFNIGRGSNDTVTLHDSGNNVVNVLASGSNASIGGLTTTDVIHFGDTFRDASITAKGGHTTVAFADGQTITLIGVHDAATFGGDPSIHYI
jgi:hypothetical protein